MANGLEQGNHDEVHEQVANGQEQGHLDDEVRSLQEQVLVQEHSLSTEDLHLSSNQILTSIQSKP